MTYCLVADDSAVIRKVARRIVEGLALRCEEAEDGEQALALCRVEMPDLILLDSSMPVADGFDVLRELRRLVGGGREPKVVFCTTEHDVGQIARAMHAGADRILLKPFTRGALVEALQGVRMVDAPLSQAS